MSIPRPKARTWWWLVSGAAVGAVGYMLVLVLMSAVIEGFPFGKAWEPLVIVLCPADLISRGWWTLVLNSAIYALLFSLLRFAWLRVRSQSRR